MLQYEAARTLYEEITVKKARCHKDGFDELYQDFLQSAVEYANVRLSWSFMNLVDRRADDASRTIKHDGFMAILNAVCRNLDIKDVDKIMPERKSKGDFACYIALFLALEQR